MAVHEQSGRGQTSRAARRATLACYVSLILAAASPATVLAAPAPSRADLMSERASADVRRLADWVVVSADNKAMPFVIVDKVKATVFVFHPNGRLRGEAPALVGMARGDESAPGIGQRKLSTIRPEERTTPAGRFVASIGNDLGDHQVLWIDYEAAISLHRVVAGRPKERRAQRLASASPDDNRISYGCINVPVRFFETVVLPAFTGTSGVVYILPEVRSLHDVFGSYDVPPPRGE